MTNNIPIECLKLSNATRNLLKRNNVLTLQELEGMTVRTLSSCGIGPKRYDELRKVIKEVYHD